jgi:hypothetical protein
MKRVVKHPTKQKGATLKLETAGSYKTLATIYQTTRRDNPDDCNLHQQLPVSCRADVGALTELSFEGLLRHHGGLPPRSVTIARIEGFINQYHAIWSCTHARVTSSAARSSTASFCTCYVSGPTETLPIVRRSLYP